MKIINYVDSTARIGKGSVVWHFAVILRNVFIGENCSIGSGAEIGERSHIGQGTRVSARVFMPPRSIIGDQVFIGPGTVFTDDFKPKAGHKYKGHPPIVCDRASIGAGCVILPGVVIGVGAMIGAGSVVTKNVPPRALIYGEPATIRNI
jgi:UDP-2-acetamido-3-amino-2,3-dideoxy-glucuronate N-acetyltransferase